MPTIGSVTKTIRIAPRDLEVINALMADGTSWSGAIHKLCEGVPTKISEKSGLTPNKDLKEIESMAKFFGMSTEEVLKGIYNGLNDGYLTVESGKIVGVPEIDLTELEEAARERNMTVEVVIDRTIKNLRSGK